MNRWFVVLAAAVLALALLGLLTGRPAPPGPLPGRRPVQEVRTATGPLEAHAAPKPGGGAPASTAQAAELAADGVRLLPGAREMVQGLNDPDRPAEADLEILEEALAQFRRVFGRNPPGGANAEIMAALTGRNNRNLAVMPPRPASMNADGELLDRWGEPFHFHPVSSTVMEVVSSGPDRLLWTPDDVGAVHAVDGPVGP